MQVYFKFYKGLYINNNGYTNHTVGKASINYTMEYHHNTASLFYTYSLTRLLLRIYTVYSVYITSLYLFKGLNFSDKGRKSPTQP